MIIEKYLIAEAQIDEIDYTQKYFFNLRMRQIKDNIDGCTRQISWCNNKTKKEKEWTKKNKAIKEIYEEAKLKLIKLYIDNLEVDLSPKYYENIIFKK